MAVVGDLKHLGTVSNRSDKLTSSYLACCKYACSRAVDAEHGIYVGKYKGLKFNLRVRFVEVAIDIVRSSSSVSAEVASRLPGESWRLHTRQPQ